jgi:hypothetical protein
MEIELTTHSKLELIMLFQNYLNFSTRIVNYKSGSDSCC